MSRPGRRARTALLVLLGFYVLTSVLTGAFGRRDPGSTVDDIMQVTGPIIGVGVAAAGLASLVFGLRAFITHRERSFIVWLALVFGVLAALFIIGEFAVPH